MSKAAKSKSKSKSKLKKSITSINVDEINFIIRKNIKPPQCNVKLTVEGSCVYFGGPNWRINFKDLNRGIILQINNLLSSCSKLLDPSGNDNDNNNGNDNDNGNTYYDALENHNHGDYDYDNGSRSNYDDGEREVTFRSIDNQKKFHCRFHLPTPSSSLYSTLPPSAQLRKVQAFLSFFKKFQKLYDRWQSKHFPQGTGNSSSNSSIMDIDNGSASLRSFGRLGSSHSHSHHRGRTTSNFSSNRSSYYGTSSSTMKSKQLRKQKTYGKKQISSKRTNTASLYRKTLESFDDDDDHDHDDYKYNYQETKHKVSNDMNVNMDMDMDMNVDNGSSILEQDDNSNPSIPDVCTLDNEDDNDVCSMEEEDGEERVGGSNNSKNLRTKRRKRSQRGGGGSSSSTRRLKKLRSEPANGDIDSDSDVDFTEPSETTTSNKRASLGRAFVDDDDDDDDDDNNGGDEDDISNGYKGQNRESSGEGDDHENRNDDDSDAIRPSSTNNMYMDRNEKTKQTTQFLSTPAVTVSPAFNNNSKKDQISLKKDILSDAVTDDEEDKNPTLADDGDNNDRANSSEKTASIKNFFKPRSLTDTMNENVDSASDVGKKTKQSKSETKIDISPSTPPQRDIPDLKGDTRSSSECTSKYFSKNAQERSSRSRADRILNLSSSPKNSIIKKLRATPTKTISDQQKSPEPKKMLVNPYKSKPQEETSPHIGLKNRGNTCYLNSSLQMIFSVPSFVSSLQRIYEKYNKKEGEASSMPLTEAFLKVASDVNIITPGGTAKPADPYNLKEAIDILTDKFTGYEQRDAHEFASALIDYIHDELIKATKNQKVLLPTDEYFRLDVKVCLTCDSCKYTR